MAAPPQWFEVPSYRELERRRCRRKRRFVTLQAAKARLAEIKARADYRPGELEVYRCRFCNGLHVGNRRGNEWEAVDHARVGQ